ncbi:MAG: hypothetical protein ACK5NG_11445 [Chthoniobacterales bacterium]
MQTRKKSVDSAETPASDGSPNSGGGSTTVKAKRGCFGRLLRLVFVMFLLVFLTTLFSIWLFQKKLPEIALWSLNRSLPNIQVELGDMRFSSWDHLVVESLAFKDKQTGEVLGSMQRGELAINYMDLLNGQIRELKFENPVFYFSPRLFSLFAAQPRNSEIVVETNTDEKDTDPSDIIPPLLIERLWCEFGEIYVHGFTEEELAISLRFSFDWENVGMQDSFADKKHELILWSVSASNQPDYKNPFAWIDLLRAELTLRDLLKKRQLGKITLEGGSVTFGPELQKFFPKKEEPTDEKTLPKKQTPPATEAKPSHPWHISEISIQNLKTRIDGPHPDVADIDLAINTSFQNIALSSLAADLGDELQRIEFANIEVLSPTDPLIRVITLRSVFITFSLSDILHKHIRKLEIVSPSIYVSQDLFAYMEAMKKAYFPDEETPEDGEDKKESTPEKPSESEGSGWVINHLDISLGRLVLAGERLGNLGLPLNFQISVNDVRLDDLTSLRLKSSLEVRSQDFSFPSMKLDLTNLHGELQFSYPPTDMPSNLVNTLYLDDLKWRQYDASELWLSSTLDRQVISARFGGKAYGGYITAGADFFFGDESRWLGWITGTGIDLKKLTDILTPENVTLTGPADFSIQIDAAATRIDRLVGNLVATGTGDMRITKLDEVLKKLPADWSQLKRQLGTIAIESLRDYPYESAKSDFWFVEDQGQLILRLAGPTGKRNFEINLHSNDAKGYLWKDSPQTTTP